MRTGWLCDARYVVRRDWFELFDPGFFPCTHAMVLPQALPMRDSEECDATPRRQTVDRPFHVHADGASALVQNRKLRLVVKQPAEGESLLLPS